MNNEELQQEIAAIKERNKRVEADKAWEISWTRKGLILILTYIVIVIFFWVADLGRNPFLNAIVPTVGLFFSSLSVPFVKEWWITRYQK